MVVWWSDSNTYNEDIWFNYPIKRGILRLVAFGSTKAVDVLHFKFVAQRWLGAKLYSNDLVTRLPPTLLGFRYAIKLKHIGDKRIVLGILKAKRNHHIDTYIKNLREDKTFNPLTRQTSEVALL